MLKPLNEYKAIILDMDGTLYFQLPVRLLMALSLGVYYLFHPARRRELRILRDYRQMREARKFADSPDFTTRQFQALGEKYGLETERIKKVIDYWMGKRPLTYVRRFRDTMLIHRMEQLRGRGALIIVYSDYPVKEKVLAVDLTADYMFHAGNKEIDCMKPDPKGLLKILEITGISKSDALFIGDRYSKDGLCAKAAGVDFIILSKHSLGRKLNRYGGLY